MRIIIYGLGHRYKQIEKCLRSKHEIVGYTDSFSAIKYWGIYKFIEVSALEKESFDYLILNIEDRKAVESIKRNLEFKHKIPLEKVVDFYDIFKKGILPQKVDRVLMNTNKSYTGIIIGISHAVCGIRSDFLRGGGILQFGGKKPGYIL